MSCWTAKERSYVVEKVLDVGWLKSGLLSGGTWDANLINVSYQLKLGTAALEEGKYTSNVRTPTLYFLDILTRQK